MRPIRSFLWIGSTRSLEENRVTDEPTLDLVWAPDVEGALELPLNCFDGVILDRPDPATLEEEVDIVLRRVEALGQALELPAEKPSLEEVRRVVTVFRELRSGTTLDGKAKLKSPSATLSTAEAISVVNSGLSLAAHFGDGQLRAADMAAGITGAIVKDPVQDRVVWLEYLETVVKERSGWKDLYRACRDIVE